MIIIRILGIFIIMVVVMTLITLVIPSISVSVEEQLIFCAIISVLFGIVEGD
jgi:hypothetical protein